MNAHVKVGGEVALQRSLSEVVAEYEEKRAALGPALAAFHKAGNELKSAATIGGTYGNVTINTGDPYARTLEESLLKSAWKHVYDGLQIDRLSSPTDKNLWKQALEKPAPFTLDNIRGTFGKFIQDPRGNILRGLAEVFCGLDPYYKSHDNMKIGVKGLPKRVVIGSCGPYSSYGRDKIESILNALAVYQGKPLVTYRELTALFADENALLVRTDLPKERHDREGEVHSTPGRGVRLRRFGNGNGHLFFEKDTLVDINKALAEFYGEVLPDTPDENPVKAKSTAVSKDLQYYPTPQKVIDNVLDWVHHLDGQRVLEPSCGDGRFLDALVKRKAIVYGVEVDPMRAVMARAKGHSVLIANFLETAPNPIYDRVIMNPPFFGTHWSKHVRHAFSFLKPGGVLTAILPVTAQGSGLIDDLVGKDRYNSPWRDLPVGSFSESGTNINTVTVTIHKDKK